MENQKLKVVRIWPHLLKKPLMENFIFCAMKYDILELHFGTLFKNFIYFILVLELHFNCRDRKKNTDLFYITSFTECKNMATEGTSEYRQNIFTDEKCFCSCCFWWFVTRFFSDRFLKNVVYLVFMTPLWISREDKTK